ncbi:MAG: response regulator transcription factor [Bacteroidetes bacterium]|nr:MAG: response regulator transcription factor [Bacteroidota bacterium]
MTMKKQNRPAKNLVRVAIVDDDADLANGIAWIIDRSGTCRTTGIYRSSAALLRGLGEHPADVVLMDIGLQGESGIDAVRALKRFHPDVQVVMQTVYSEDEKIFQSLRAGAVGYILKKNTPEAVLHAITEAHRGGVPFTGEVARKVLQYFSAPEPAAVDIDTLLSDREKEVLRELVQGHTYKSIAERLFISLPTVRFHLQNIYKKLHVRSRNEVVAKLGGGRELLRR